MAPALKQLTVLALHKITSIVSFPVSWCLGENNYDAREGAL